MGPQDTATQDEHTAQTAHEHKQGPSLLMRCAQMHLRTAQGQGQHQCRQRNDAYPSPLSPRQKICSRKKGRRKSGKRGQIREKSQATKKGSSYLKKYHVDQEDDHESLRDSMSAMEP